jgi:hypothetical protein
MRLIDKGRVIQRAVHYTAAGRGYFKSQIVLRM